MADSAPKILVIDDSPTARLLMKDTLEQAGMIVHSAADQRQGTYLAYSLEPDVVVLDVVLPDADGIELCKKWNQDEQLKDIPILLVSGERSNKDDRVAALFAGAYGYIAKPFHREEVVAQVRLLYKLAHSRKLLHEQIVIAESANKSKSEFLANMSHEIRTPLTAIIGFAENLLLPDISSQEYRDSAAIINQSGKHLLNILNDILDVSKIEAGAMEVEHIPCSPIDIVRSVSALMSPRATEKGLNFEVKVKSAIPEQVFSDPTRLKQILLNLCGNAIKFTESGKVSLSISYVTDSGRLRFKVSDTGPGIEPEAQAKLFEAFAQANASISRNYGGTGLGLNICKRLTTLMGGSIDFSSEIGKGTTFLGSVQAPCDSGVRLITVPHEILSGEHLPTTAQSIFTTALCGNVLIVDDGVSNQLLLSSILKKAGASVEVANDGEQGIEKALSKKFDLILMDSEMPKLSGLSAIKILREKGYNRPIITVSAHAMTDQIEECILAGSDDCVTKPIDRRDFLTKVARHIGA